MGTFAKLFLGLVAGSAVASVTEATVEKVVSDNNKAKEKVKTNVTDAAFWAATVGTVIALGRAFPRD